MKNNKLSKEEIKYLYTLANEKLYERQSPLTEICLHGKSPKKTLEIKSSLFDLITNSEYVTINDKCMKKIQDKILEEKNKKLKIRLKELNIKLNFDKIEEFRFKPIISEIQGNKETYYYNDGSKNGLKILTVEQHPINSIMNVNDYLTFE